MRSNWWPGECVFRRDAPAANKKRSLRQPIFGVDLRPNILSKGLCSPQSLSSTILEVPSKV